VAALLEEAEEDLLAFYAFPADHGRSCARRTRWSASNSRLCWTGAGPGFVSGEARADGPARRVDTRETWLEPAIPSLQTRSNGGLGGSVVVAAEEVGRPAHVRRGGWSLSVCVI
jgi:hypothetical protein